ncbi:sulfite exporter TauE/SafE family protein [Salinibacterium sp. UTAS2018]|uniref:sulfite exporter TauE/SafE family protein n=1 Tax=Salinibacterium sp. UTAS2018 TaxID=2508880 RepID=UPI0010094EA2|nr:sulfite exporter TauE/SafE family protein [Salinibacterium sp. UTAS2018]QAV70468.1 sulfite exporter TauE/SafE family protein [Salinibacterium sp. UTAS2018]
MLAFVALSILIGALSQRITGMGFALVCSPIVVILLGPFDGVLVVNFSAVILSLLILPRVWKRIEWRAFAWLVIPAVLTIVPGSLLAAHLPGPVLQLGVGILVLLALTATLLITRANHVVAARPAAIMAGAASGFMNTAAGVGGPALSIYAVLTRWPQAKFAATLQPYFIVIGSVSLVSKIVFSGGELPQLDVVSWVVIIGALVSGFILGEVLNRHISHSVARTAVIIVAYIGGAVAVIEGALHLQL